MKQFFLLLVLAYTFLAIPIHAAHAAIMSLDPASASAPVGGTFTVKVTIDTEGETVTSADAILLYDSTRLQVQNIVEGDSGQQPFFPDFFQNIGPSQLYIGASVIDPIDTRIGQGILATITFQGIAAGIADVTFDCTPGKTSDTNISKSDKNATDIVECARLTPGRYTIGAGEPTATPIPVGGPIIPTSTPLPIPTSGSFEVTTAVFGMGIVLILFALGGRVLLKV